MIQIKIPACAASCLDHQRRHNDVPHAAGHKDSWSAEVPDHVERQKNEMLRTAKGLIFAAFNGRSCRSQQAAAFAGTLES